TSCLSDWSSDVCSSDLFAIDEYAADWRQTKGIQGSGEGRQLLNPDEIRHAVELFQEKFEALTGGLPSNISLFRITPTELQFIDRSEERRVGKECKSMRS